MKAKQALTVLLAVCTFLAGIGGATAGPITFSEVTNGLSGTMIFADASLDGALVNAGTGDQTGINPGNSGGSNWGRVDTSFNANNATPGGNQAGLHSNVLEGISTAAPDLKWTVSAGSGDDASNGAGSLLANTNYNVYVHYLTHTAGSQNWGGEMSNIATFATFDQFDNNDGTLITTVPAPSNPVVDYRRFELTSSVTTDGSGNAELFIRRPTSGTHVRTIIDGVVFQEAGPPPPGPVGRFDVNDGTSTATPPTQVGFAGLGGDTYNASATSGGVTLTLTQIRNDRAREGGTGGQVAGSSLPDVYRDFTHGDTYFNAQAKVHLSGLIPGQPYDLRWYHYENRSGNFTHNARVYENGVAAGNLLFTATNFGNNTDPDVTGFSDFTVAAKSDGTIDLVTGSHLPGAAGSGVGDRSITYFDGLDVSLSAAPPEPIDASIARWDVNDEGTTPTQSGFAPLNGNVASQTVASGPISLTMTQSTGRDRDNGGGGPAGSSSLPDLYRDFTHGDTLFDATIALLLGGLDPESEYRMRWYHYESRNNPGDSPVTVYRDDPGDLANLLFTTIITGTEGDPDAAGFTDFFVTPDANGQVSLVTGLAPTGGRSISYFNGLEVFEPVAAVVPEPSTFILAALGLVALAWCGCRRKSQRGRS